MLYDLCTGRIWEGLREFAATSYASLHSFSEAQSTETTREIVYEVLFPYLLPDVYPARAAHIEKIAKLNADTALLLA